VLGEARTQKGYGTVLLRQPGLKVGDRIVPFNTRWSCQSSESFFWVASRWYMHAKGHGLAISNFCLGVPSGFGFLGCVLVGDRI